MADPRYTIDFTPVSDIGNVLSRNRLLQLKANEDARAQAQLDMTQEKFGWERQDEAARNAAARELAADPNAWEKARKAALAGGNLKTAAEIYGVQGTAGNLSATEFYRDYVRNGGQMPANPGAARLNATGPARQAAPDASAQPASDADAARRNFAVTTADILGKHYFGEPDPNKRMANYNAMLTHPALAQSMADLGYTGQNPDAEARHMWEDAFRSANGHPPIGPYKSETAANGIAVASAPAGTPQVPQSAAMSPQVGAVPPTPPQQPAVGQAANITPADREAIVRIAIAEGGDPFKVASSVLQRAKLTGKSPAEIVQSGQYNGFGSRNFVSAMPGTPLYEKTAAALEPLLTGQAQPFAATHFVDTNLQAAQGRPMPNWAQGEPAASEDGRNYYNRPGDFARAPTVPTVPTQTPPPMALGGPQAQQPQQPELPSPMFSGMAFTPPQLTAGAPSPQAAQPQPQAAAPAPANLAQPQPSNGLTPDQQLANEMIRQKRQDINVMKMTPNLAAAAEQEQKSLDEQIKSGQIFVPQIGKMVPIAQHAENLASVKAKEETATGRAKFFETVHGGLSGSGQVAAQQRQNIGVLEAILADPHQFGFGSAAGLQQSTLNALATVGWAPEVATNRALFDMIVAKVLNDQFSGMRALSSETGEKGARVFKSMLDVEERAIPHPNDSIDALRAKVGLLKHSGTQMMKWADLADTYADAHGGSLSNAFMIHLRHEIANSPIFGGAQPKGEQQQEAGAPGAAGQNAAQPAAAKLTPQQQAEYPLGTKMRFKEYGNAEYSWELGPNGQPGWKKLGAEAAPANQPAAADLQRRAQMTPVERAAENRAAAEARRAAAPAQAAAAAQEQQQQASQVQRGYGLDKLRIPPEDLVRKYSNVIGQLSPEQQRHYQSVLNALVPMNPRR